MLHEFLEYTHSALCRSEALILNTRLDDIQRCGETDRCNTTGDRRHRVLSEGSLTTIGETETILVNQLGTTEKGERT